MTTPLRHSHQIKSIAPLQAGRCFFGSRTPLPHAHPQFKSTATLQRDRSRDDLSA
ncbi:hypothetical protein SPRG_15631, partial [Saprolegnia parasitica CBS 223.65]